MEIDLSDIIIPAGRKTRGELTSMKESIRDFGLFSPILVRELPGGKYALVDGRNRFECHRRLKLESIEANVQPFTDEEAQIAEIDANMCRIELTALERSELTDRRYDLWRKVKEARQNREAKRDKDGGWLDDQKYAQAKKNEIDKNLEKDSSRDIPLGQVGPEDENEESEEPRINLSEREFAREVSEKIGRSERSVRRDLSTGRKLARGAAKILKGTPWESKGIQLEKLARLPRSTQLKVARVMTGRGMNVDQAAEYVKKKGMAGPRPYPPEMDAVFGKYKISLLQQLSKLAKARSAIERLINVAIDRNEEGDVRFALPKGAWQWISPELGTVLKSIRDEMLPVGPCPKCSGKGCKQCDQGGWQSEAGLKRLDPGGYLKLERW